MQISELKTGTIPQEAAIQMQGRFRPVGPQSFVSIEHHASNDVRGISSFHAAMERRLGTNYTTVRVKTESGFRSYFSVPASKGNTLATVLEDFNRRGNKPTKTNNVVEAAAPCLSNVTMEVSLNEDTGEMSAAITCLNDKDAAMVQKEAKVEKTSNPMVFTTTLSRSMQTLRNLGAKHSLAENPESKFQDSVSKSIGKLQVS